MKLGWLALLLVAQPCLAGDIKLKWENPAFEPVPVHCESLSAVPETTLASIEVYAVRLKDQDTLYLGSIPAAGRESKTDSADYSFLNGTMGELLYRSKDRAGNLSCGYAHYVFAVPADSTWDQQGSPGLNGEYFDTINLTGPSIPNIDGIIDFNWGLGSPDPTIGVDTFSARWTGFLTPAFSETYTFYTVSDDGMRLWVDSSLVVSSWIDQGATEHSGTIALLAGHRVPITVEYYEDGGAAISRLLWSSPRQPKQAVPAAALSH